MTATAAACEWKSGDEWTEDCLMWVPQNGNHHQQQAHRRQSKQKQDTPADVGELHKSSDQHDYLPGSGEHKDDLTEPILPGRFPIENWS